MPLLFIATHNADAARKSMGTRNIMEAKQ